jgi:hypothetical protein
MLPLLFTLIFFSPTAAWGWVGLVLLAVVVAIPYLRRNSSLASPGSPAAAPRPYLTALAPHYWLAPAVLVISFVHAWIPMASGHMPQTSMRGLWLATYALGVIFLQLLIGLALRYMGPRVAHAMRRVHFVLMLGIVALVLSHVWLNGPFVNTLTATFHRFHPPHS